MTAPKFNHYYYAATPLLLALTGCAHITPQQGTQEIAAETAIYAAMASNAYRSSGKPVFALQSAGWYRIDLQGKATEQLISDHPVTGLAYDIYAKESGDTVVFAFRGSEGIQDYLMSNFALIAPSYRQARSLVQDYVNSHTNQQVIVTGHSLGGGLAMSASLKAGVTAYAFNSSPRVFDGFLDKSKPATRKVVYQRGEVLANVRNIWRKLWSVVPESNIYEFQCDYRTLGTSDDSHDSALLAQCLLQIAASTHGDLAEVLSNTSGLSGTQH